MKRAFATCLAALLFLGGLCLLLRRDLAALSWREGRRALSSGEYRGALAALERAEAMGERGVAYDTGIALYRLGRVEEARGHFAKACASPDPALRVAALYNLGNCAFLEAERKSGGAPRDAVRLLQQVAKAYREVLAADPAAADARHNLDLASARLAELAAGGGDEPGKRRGRGGGRSGEGSAAGLSRAGAGQREGEDARRPERGTLTPGRKGGGDAHLPAESWKGMKRVTRDQAERLLSEARGRETLAAEPKGTGGRGRLAPPDRDW